MSKQPGKDDWVYVVVEIGDDQDVFMGYNDEASGIAYIPAFYTKEDAQDCYLDMPRERGKKYEIQATFFGDLARDATSNAFLIFMLDKTGKVLLQIDPATV